MEQYHFAGASSSMASLRHETWYAASHLSQIILPLLSAFVPQSLQIPSDPDFPARFGMVEWPESHGGVDSLRALWPTPTKLVS